VKAATPRTRNRENSRKAEEAGRDATASFTFPAHSRAGLTAARPEGPRWDDARAVVGKWETWEGEIPATAPEVTIAVKTTVERAVTAFLAHHEASSQNTQKKYRLLMKRLREFS
jgi:hypothetical protein